MGEGCPPHLPPMYLFLLQTFRSSEPFLFVPLTCTAVLPVGTRRHWQDGQNMTEGTHLLYALRKVIFGWLVGVLVGWFKGMTLGLTHAWG